MKPIPRLILVFSLGLLLPLIQIGIFMYRFDEGLETGQLLQSLAFAPAGLISAWYLTSLIPYTVHSTHRTLLFVGWFVTLPVSLMFSLIGGLMLPLWIGPWLAGLLPLLAGVWLFDRIGRKMQDPALRR